MVDMHEYVTECWTDTFAMHSPEDSDLWLDLIMFASVYDNDFAAVLMYLRNAGTVLKKDDKYGYRLVPIIGDIGWESKEQYKQETVYLKPYHSSLIHCLKKLANECS